jgi:flagellar protein FliS
MSYNEIANIYRQESTHGNHPVELVGKLYEAVLEDFRRALSAAEGGNIAERTSSLNHALQILAELQSVLDHERGGEVARRLNGLYNVTRALVIEANVQGQAARIQKLIDLYLPLRQAWKQVERDANGGTLLSASAAPAEPEAVGAGRSWTSSNEAR